jgi:hypothetical protein
LVLSCQRNSFKSDVGLASDCARTSSGRILPPSAFAASLSRRDVTVESLMSSSIAIPVWSVHSTNAAKVTGVHFVQPFPSRADRQRSWQCSMFSSFRQTLKIDVGDGGPVITELGYNIKVNKDSSLHRSFVTINAPACPAQLTGAGVTSKYGSNNYAFSGTGTPITAFEIRLVLFDMFGGRLKTLSGTHVVDLGASAPFELSKAGSWYASGNEVSELLTVAAFVANVRTAAGKVWHFNDKRVTDELVKLNLKITAGALEPTTDKK